MNNALLPLVRAVQSMLRRAGITVTRHSKREPDPIYALLERYAVDCVFDVGANTGSTGTSLRSIGYDGRIVSFEPVPQFLPELRRRAGADRLWTVEPYALGDIDQDAVINVTGSHGGASSFLQMTELVHRHAPDQRVVSQERVPVRRLDSVLENLYPNGDRLFLKMDVQGYEPRVLAGAGNAIGRIVGIQIEMSLRSTYREETLLPVMLENLAGLGYSLCWIHPTWRDGATGEVFQVDGYFFNTARNPLSRGE
jgi:FkbM family methyltransferase